MPKKCESLGRRFIKQALNPHLPDTAPIHTTLKEADCIRSPPLLMYYSQISFQSITFLPFATYTPRGSSMVL